MDHQQAKSEIDSSSPHSPTFSNEFATTALAFSPDGSQVAIGGNGWVEVWDWKTLQPPRIADTHNELLSSCDFKGNGDLLSAGGSGLLTWKVGEKLAGYKSVHELASGAAGFYPIEVSADQGILLTESAPPGTRRFDVIDLASRQHTLLDSKWIRARIWPKHAGVIVASTGEVSSYDLRVGRFTPLASLPKPIDAESALLPASNTEAIYISTLAAGVLSSKSDVYSSSGRNVGAADHNFSANSMQFFGVSADGADLLAFDPSRTIWLCDAAIGRRVEELGNGGACGGAYAFSSDNNYVAIGTELGTELWDLKLQKRLAIRRWQDVRDQIKAMSQGSY